MLVEVATGISPVNKDLFVSLCQSYEQQSIATSCPLDELQESLPHWASSVSNLMQETTQPSWPISTLCRSALSWQQGVGFVVINRVDVDWDNGSVDWDDVSR